MIKITIEIPDATVKVFQEHIEKQLRDTLSKIMDENHELPSITDKELIKLSKELDDEFKEIKKEVESPGPLPFKPKKKHGGSITKKTRICEKCGEEFTPSGNRQKYCSMECGLKFKKYIKKGDRNINKRICKNCHNEYTPKSNGQKFCSVKCKKIYHGIPLVNEKLCPVCLTTFKQKNNRQIFCSPECKKSHNSIKKEKKEEINKSGIQAAKAGESLKNNFKRCINCGASFDCIGRSTRDVDFCTKRCKDEYELKQTRQQIKETRS